MLIILSTWGSGPLHAGIHSPPDQRQVPPRDQRKVPPSGPEAGTPQDQRQVPPRTRGRNPRDQRQEPPGSEAGTPQDQRQVPPGPEAGTPGIRGRNPRDQRQEPPRTRGRYPPGPEAGTPGIRGRNPRDQRQVPPRTRGRYPPGPEAGTPQEQTASLQSTVNTRRYGQQAGGMHPTGMQSYVRVQFTRDEFCEKNPKIFPLIYIKLLENQSEHDTTFDELRCISEWNNFQTSLSHFIVFGVNGPSQLPALESLLN